ncbi:hypothetical protein, partial [Stutzerimonas stutzeri]|uniref:hypothetical protein n=1 Tax=Stutzerimonas stutzeri TaxID=316 RepID=UPI001BAFC5C1
RVPEPGAGSGTAANIKGSVTRSRDNYLENRRFRECLNLSGLHWASRFVCKNGKFSPVPSNGDVRFNRGKWSF